MATDKEIREHTNVTCEVCLKEVPLSAAKAAEVNDYFVHFCGLECYEKWRSHDVKSQAWNGAKAT